MFYQGSTEEIPKCSRKWGSAPCRRSQVLGLSEGKRKNGSSFHLLALDGWLDPVSIDTRLKNNAVLAECEYGKGRVSKQAPFTRRNSGGCAGEDKEPILRRAYEAGAQPMSYGSVR